MSNEEYWELRMINSQKQTEKQVTKGLVKMYQALMKKVDSEIVQLWLDMSQEGEVSHSNMVKSKRYEELVKFLQVELNKIGKYQIDNMQLSLLDVFINAGKDLLEFAGADVPYVMDETIAKEVINQNYKSATFSDRVWENISELRSKLTDLISISAIAGKDVRKLSKELQNLLNSGFNESRRIVITETSRVFNEGCRKQAIETGIFKTYTILNEKKACEKCVELYGNGKKYPLSKSILPVHPYCKCTMLIDIE